MTSLIITKTGRIELERAIRVTSVSLKSITLYMSMYNLHEVSTFTYNNRRVTIQPGYYTYDQLMEKLPRGSFKVHENTLRVSTGGTITGALAKLIKNDYLYLTPLCLYINADVIDTAKNLLNGNRSDVLGMIPIGKTDTMEIIKYKAPDSPKATNDVETNAITFSIQDEWGNEFMGKFIAEILLQ